MTTICIYILGEDGKEVYSYSQDIDKISASNLIQWLTRHLNNLCDLYQKEG